MSKEFAFKLESKYMVTWEYGHMCAPKQAVTLAQKESDCGISTGFAYYEGKWYLIQTSGQGPYVIWEENAL